MTTEGLFFIVDVAKAVLLKRMERESKLVLNDTFLSEKQRLAGFTLFHAVGEDFVEYVASLHVVKTPEFLFVLAKFAIENFQDNLGKCWVFSYDSKLGPANQIKWMSENKLTELTNEF